MTQFFKEQIDFVLSFENEGDRKVHTGYYLPKLEIKDYNVIIDGKNFFDQPVKSDMKRYVNRSRRRLDNGYLLDYNYFKK